MTPALLLLNGEIEDPAAVKRLAKKAFVVCTDGGLRHAGKLKIGADLVIGDMDSLPKPLPKLGAATFLCDFDEERSDLEKALAWLYAQGPGEVFVAGALGGRLDHMLVNLALLAEYGKRLPLTLVGAGRARLAGPGRHALKARRGAVVSLLPAGAAAVVSTEGLRYPLKRERLRVGSRGLSNRVSGARAAVRVHRGRLWIVEA